MLFLYKIQNDPFESASYNACEVRGNSLKDLANTLEDVLGQDFRQGFAWRLRKSDSGFGYIWKDVADSEMSQALDGEFVLVRLLRTSMLANSQDRLPIRTIGQTTYQSQPAAPAKVSANGARKRGQQDMVPPSMQSNLSERTNQPTTRSDRDETDFDGVFDQAATTKPPMRSSEPLAPKPSMTPIVPPVEDDGLSAEERARIRIEERERAEKAEMERKVQEVRDADAAAQANADARAAAWAELRSKLENWSGTEKNRKPIRALLSTMHTILWEGAKWTPISILVRPNEVRLAFRKAMLVVHPDKIASGSPPQVQVIAKYCFENLNAAYEKFEATEMKG